MDNDIENLTEQFKGLQKGDNESEVLNKLQGLIYAKRSYIENGEAISYYRIYFYGEVNPEAKNFYDRNESRYLELTFRNGQLSAGQLFSENYQNNKNSVSVEYVK